MVIGPATPGLPASEIVVGLDIGQRQDYSAIAVLETLDESDGTRDPVTYEFRRWKTIQLRHAERIRIGTPFAGVVDRVSDIVSDPRLRGCTLVADATGVGAPVVEMLRAADLPCRLIAAQITGGIDEGSDGPSCPEARSRRRIAGVVRSMALRNGKGLAGRGCAGAGTRRVQGEALE